MRATIGEIKRMIKEVLSFELSTSPDEAITRLSSAGDEQQLKSLYRQYSQIFFPDKHHLKTDEENAYLTKAFIDLTKAYNARGRELRGEPPEETTSLQQSGAWRKQSDEARERDRPKKAGDDVRIRDQNTGRLSIGKVIKMQGGRTTLISVIGLGLCSVDHSGMISHKGRTTAWRVIQ